MNTHEYAEARNDLITILDKQPNLLGQRQANADMGKDLAEFMFAFIQQHCELRKKAAGPSLP